MIYKILPHIFAAPPSNCEHFFFGLVPWYHYLPSSDFGPQKGLNANTISACDINANFNVLHGNSMALILIAIVDDLLRIAGIVAIGFILYGAIQFTTSQGSPDQTAKARNTIINALIGLAICIVAIALVSYLGSVL